MIQGNRLYRPRRSCWSLHLVSLAQAQQKNFLSDCRTNTVCGVNIKGITITGVEREEVSLVERSWRMSVYLMSPRGRHCLLECFGSQALNPEVGPVSI